MSKQAIDRNNHEYPALFQGTVTNLAISGTAATMSNPVNTTTDSVTLTADVDCWVLISAGGTAATSANAEHLPASVKWVRAVTGNTSKVSVITKVSGVTGNLNIVEDA